MGKYCYDYPMFAFTADVVVVYEDKVLLIERKNPPYGWALPGGFTNINERSRQAAVRELFEETNIIVDERNLDFTGIWDDPNRDPRQRTVTLVFKLNATYLDIVNMKAGDDAKSACFVPIDDLRDMDLVIDHKHIILTSLSR